MARVSSAEPRPAVTEGDLAQLALFERWRFVRREILGVTQRELAAAIEINVRQLKNYEHPEHPRGAPSLESARRLVGVLGPGWRAEWFAAPAPTAFEEINRKLDLIMAHLGIEDQ